MQAFDVTVDPILVPRVVGSANHVRVKQYIIDQMKSLGWDIETDKFSGNTPFGNKVFENIIATVDPQAKRNLVLACHFDSKFSKEDTFIGATDSAVPCAMMITLARDLAPQLDKLKQSGQDLTLQFIFFDGEEAFKQWNSRDSIYGARHLAQKWSGLSYPPNNRERTNYLNRMDLMVLLDLLGARNPKFFNYVPSGSRWFQHAIDIETRLKNANLLVSGSDSFFESGFSFGGIEDDHVPFMQRGVPILHLIPSPFPSVWHTDDDNKNALDYPTIDDLNRILRVFVAEYLSLPIEI
jgi:glutaminyl-peptide cyclotransferase